MGDREAIEAARLYARATAMERIAEAEERVAAALERQVAALAALGRERRPAQIEKGQVHAQQGLRVIGWTPESEFLMGSAKNGR